MTQIDKTGVSGQGTSLENAKALEESPLVASLRAHISKWYSTPREERTKKMSDVYEGVEVSG